MDVDPAKLRAYDLPLGSVYSAIASSNKSVGGKVVVSNNSEYLVRGIGWLEGMKDLENVAVASRNGVPILLKQVASVQLGPEFRRSALEKDGREAVGGVVMMRYGQNPLEVTRLIKEKIREMQAGLPTGVRVVPFYDRTRLIESAIHTVTGTLREEIIIASIAILLILTHLRSAFVVCVTLPLAALISFLFMYYLEIPSNIMSLSGIAISIGILVDAAVVMVENATHELKNHYGQEKVRGDTTEIVIRACRLVGRPIFFSVLIMLISFFPVFAFGGQEGKLSHPLAYTKSFAMVGVAVLAITLVPAMIPLFIRGRLKGEEENWIVRSFINVYKPVLSWVIDRPGFVWWLMAVILSLGAGFISSAWVSALVLGLGVVFVLMGTHGWWRAAAVVTLVGIAFVADTRFGKLGGEFMPSLNEGSIMDMPTSAPRIAMAEAVDDVMVRDRVMRSLPEVEQVVGKIGRADTATDPSPIDMVETIVNLRPRDEWPKRKMAFEDAIRQAGVVAEELGREGYLKIEGKAPRRGEVINTATMAAMERFDRAMRELSRGRQMEYEPVVAGGMVEKAFDEVVRHLEKKGDGSLLRRPSEQERSRIVLAMREHGLLLAKNPRQEEVDKLLTGIRGELVRRKIAAERDDLLVDAPEAFRETVNFVKRSLGTTPADFSRRVMGELEDYRERLWAERTKVLNWELLDRAPAMMDGLLAESLTRAAAGTEMEGKKAPENLAAGVGAKLDGEFAGKLLLWQKTKDDVLKEMDSELQMPGWGNAWTQPIINRVNMLATGVRTQIGVKVFGPVGKPLGGDNGAVADVQKVSEEIAAKLKTVRGAVDVVADQAVGKRYLEIRIDEKKARHYGVNMAELAEAIETAVGGNRVTTTVEGRQRFPVRLRYARDYWQDADSIGNVLITANATPAELLGGEAGGMGKTSRSGMVQIPLKMVAEVRVTEGPSMIKSENGRLRNYVTLNVRDRDILGFVEEARQAVKPIEAKLAGTGMSIEWSGEFEHQVRARQTMAVIFPMVIALILFLLYVTFHEFLDTLLVFLAVLGALAGSLMFQAMFGFNFSVIVSIGYVAAFGMATETGVIMLVYLREAVDRHGGLEKITSLEELRRCVIEGAVHRLRPKLLTEGVAIVGLAPMLWATGTGAEIMRPMAAPVLGGLLISDEVIDLMIPVLFYWIRRARWKKLHEEERQADALPLSGVAVG